MGYPPRRAIAQNRGTPLVSRSQSPSGAVDAPFWRSRSERRPPDHYTASTAADLDGLWSTLRSPRRVVDQKSTVVHPNPPQSIGVCDDEGYPQSSQSIAQMYKLTTSSTVGVRTLLSFNEISLLISVTHLSIKSLEPKTPAQNSSILKSRHCVIRCNGFRQKLSRVSHGCQRCATWPSAAVL